MTTVGYGDAVPTTSLGKVVASITSVLGIIVLAIPITVISTNFNLQYAKMKKDRAIVTARMKLLKSHFENNKTGLDAMLDEMDELVKRTKKEFMKKVEETVDNVNLHMTEEIRQIVRIAYKRRARAIREGIVSGPNNGTEPLSPARKRGGSVGSIAGLSSTTGVKAGGAEVAPVND